MGRLLIICVICRPDFEQLLAILRFSPLLFANISVQMTLKTQLMHLTNITYHRVNTQNISRYMLCLSFTFELIKRPGSASKFSKLGSGMEKTHVNSYCSKCEKHVGNF